MTTLKNHISVFISYAWNKQNKDFVDWLYTFLSDKNKVLEQKINIFMDRNSTRLGDDLNSFMTGTLINSDFVICLLDNEYLERMDTPGTGVFQEVNEIKKNKNNIQIIPIHVYGHDQPSGVFNKLKYITININNPDDNKNITAYQQLLDKIFSNTDTVNMLKPKGYKCGIDNLIKKAFIQENRNFNPRLSGTSTINTAFNNGIFSFGSGQQLFTTMWTHASNNEVYSYNVQNSNSQRKQYLYVCTQKKYEDINNPLDVNECLYIRWSPEKPFSNGTVLLWINEHKIMMVGKISDISKDSLKLTYKIL